MPKYKVNDIVKCCVTGITLYGFFAQFDEEYVGLCHISEVSSEYVSDINDFVYVGETIYARILDIDEETKRMNISIKDIYYKTEDDGNIVESRKGFLSLKQMLPVWIKEKMDEYDNSEGEKNNS